MVSDPREDRLPKWAQETLRRYREDIDDLRRALDEAKGVDPRHPVAVRDPYGEAVPVAWDRYDSVRFFLRNTGNQSQWIDVRRARTGEIEVVASSAIHIRMQASNVMYLIDPEAVVNR